VVFVRIGGLGPMKKLLEMQGCVRKEHEKGQARDENRDEPKCEILLLLLLPQHHSYTRHYCSLDRLSAIIDNTPSTTRESLTVSRELEGKAKAKGDLPERKRNALEHRITRILVATHH